MNKFEKQNPVLLADGLEDAFIGSVYSIKFGINLAVYDIDKCVEILVTRDGMSDEEAIEFLEFNTFCAWVGEGTPLFLARKTLDDFNAELEQ